MHRAKHNICYCVLVNNEIFAARFTLQKELFCRRKDVVFSCHMSVKKVDGASFLYRSNLEFFINFRIQFRFNHIVRKHKVGREDRKPVAERYHNHHQHHAFVA